MQTLVAYAVDRTGRPQGHDGASRVARHYAPLAGSALRHESVELGGLGLHVWEAYGERRRWPMWQRERDLTVATLYTPVDYEDVTGDLPPEAAAVPLARRLLARPDSVLRLGGPFVLTAMDPAGLVLMTDAFGLGRLFELRVPGGWVWSNRPVAAHLFADVPVRPDRRGWRFHAAADWFMDDSTPCEGMTAVGPATTIRIDARGGRSDSQLDPLSAWLDGPADPLEPAALDRVAAALQRTARSAARLWTETPKIGLSGGRDSRVVTAAFLSAGVEVRLHTNANPPGEADVARDLLQRWGRDVQHEVRQTASTAVPLEQQTGAVDRALGWMRYSEALHPASYLPRTPPSTHARAAHLLVSGVAGELAHGHYYPPDVSAVQALAVAEQLTACARHLKRRLIPRQGPNAGARAAVSARVDEVLRAAVEQGASPLVALDVFYLLERLRRWGTSADQADIVIPLLTPDFVAAALQLTPGQRRDNALHRGLVARLVPAWADVPFYAPPPGSPRRSRVPAPRLWQVDPQREVLAGVVHGCLPWADAFDAAQVHEIWQRAIGGGASAAEESVLHRVVWRAAFREYAAEVNGETVTRPAPMALTDVGKGLDAQTMRLALSRWKGRLRRQPAIRRAAHSRLGRRLRETLTSGR